jgi:predicted transcriptional regulator
MTQCAPDRFQLKRAIVLTAALMAAGCTTTAQECDPRNVSNLFSSLSCSVSGGFDAHLQAARKEVEEEQMRLTAVRAQKESQTRTNVALAGERADLNQRLERERRENDRVRLQLSALRISNDRERARVEALREKLALAEQNLTTMRQRGASTAEITRLEAENADIRKAINTIANRAKQE